MTDQKRRLRERNRAALRDRHAGMNRDDAARKHGMSVSRLRDIEKHTLYKCRAFLTGGVWYLLMHADGRGPKRWPIDAELPPGWVSTGTFVDGFGRTYDHPKLDTTFPTHDVFIVKGPQ